MVPKRNCVKNEFLRLKGTSLSKWLQDPNHLYIHGNLSRYLKKKGTSDSIWYKKIDELQEFANDEEISFLTFFRCLMKRSILKFSKSLVFKKINMKNM